MSNGLINCGNWNRIKQCMRKAENGNDILIGFLGGSITQGCLSTSDEMCYAYLVYSWWKEHFPQVNVHYNNAGIGGTTSQFGVARVEKDLLSFHPDFILIEYAVNDENTPFYCETYEGLVRKVLYDQSKPAILLMNNVRYDNEESAEEIHLKIAKYYKLPMVSMKSTILQEVKTGRLHEKDITPDGLHPNDLGHRLVAEVICSFLDEVYEDFRKGISDQPQEELITPITPNKYEKSIRYCNDNSKPITDGFQIDYTPQRDLRDIFKKGYFAYHTGDKIRFEIEGSTLAIQYRKSIQKPTPIAKVTIDNNEENAVTLDGNFQEDWGDCLYLQTIAEHIKPGKHEVEIEIIKTHKQDKVPFYLVSVISSI